MFATSVPVSKVHNGSNAKLVVSGVQIPSNAIDSHSDFWSLLDHSVDKPQQEWTLERCQSLRPVRLDLAVLGALAPRNYLP